MSERFPLLLYRCVGPFQSIWADYEYLCVNSEAEVIAQAAEGWRETLPQAIEDWQVMGIDWTP